MKIEKTLEGFDIRGILTNKILDELNFSDEFIIKILRKYRNKLINKSFHDI